MTEARKGPGPRTLLREALASESMSLARITERNLPVFDKKLTELAQESGMLPVSGNPAESNADWLAGTQGLWLFGQKADRLLRPDEVVGFVNIYEPSHMGSVNDWLASKGMHAYDKGAVVELASHAKEAVRATDAELSADKQALAKIFTDDEYKHVRAVTVWETHSGDNTLHPDSIAAMKKLGGWPLGSTRYDASEAVDSTCFLITRRQYLDAVTGQKRV